MNIYEDGGDRLDIDAARRELRATEYVTNDPIRKAQQSVIQIAALLDVAGSLRTIALESASAMGELDIAYDGGGEGEDADDEPDYLRIDDLVRYVDKLGVVETLDMDGDGTAVADVNFGEGIGVLRLYVSDLERSTKDGFTLADVREASAEVPLIGVATPDETSALLEDGDDDGEDAVGGYELEGTDRIEAAEEIDAEDLVDDIDDDFETVSAEHDGSNAGAESAVDVLRRNEEKRKAAKKAAPKKGKKS